MGYARIWYHIVNETLSCQQKQLCSYAYTRSTSTEQKANNRGCMIAERHTTSLICNNCAWSNVLRYELLIAAKIRVRNILCLLSSVRISQIQWRLSVCERAVKKSSTNEHCCWVSLILSRNKIRTPIFMCFFFISNNKIVAGEKMFTEYFRERYSVTGSPMLLMAERVQRRITIRKKIPKHTRIFLFLLFPLNKKRLPNTYINLIYVYVANHSEYQIICYYVMYLVHVGTLWTHFLFIKLKCLSIRWKTFLIFFIIHAPLMRCG